MYGRGVSRFVGATEAARLLGVQKATLYAYVSRGLIGRRVAVDGRTSLYAVDDLERVAGRGRDREVAPRPSIDVQIASAITVLDEDGPRYRGHDVADLARRYHYEQVAELLWTGRLGAAGGWGRPDDADVALAADITAVVGGHGVPAMIALTAALGRRHGGDDPPSAARRLLGVTPIVLGGPPAEGLLAARLAACWSADPALAEVLDRALVLLADHELATSTLAVRVAGSTWAGPYPAFAAGLAVMEGPLHGGASQAAYALLVECAEVGAAAAVGRRLRERERIPGYGHSIYKGGDPRLAPLMEAVGALADPDGRMAVVDELLAETGVRLTRQPNVDLGLAALAFVGGLPVDVPLFAVARLAGFAAHLVEERAERPLRFRGLARPVA